MKISDFKGVLNKSSVTVSSIENPYGDYYVIKLKTEPNLRWQPGEHGIFKIPGKKITGKKWRAFSIASIPEENLLILGTRTGKEISSFKNTLIHMRKGDKLNMSGPFGWFKFQDDTTPVVLFAGGVGITPIRALLKSAISNPKREVQVVYAASDHYLFEEELLSLASNHDHITLYQTVTPEETTEILSDLADKYSNQAYYYNSGSPKAISSVKKMLKSKGIKGNRLIDDSFMGY